MEVHVTVMKSGRHSWKTSSHHWINQVLVVQSRAITLARGGGDWMIWFNTILGVMYRDFPSLLEYLEKTMWLFPKYEEDKMSN